MGKKNAVFILLGQSNAVGHNLPMREQDKLIVPLKNVFGLSRKKNQFFDIDSLTWSGYTSFGMNLAEEQDHTYSVANCLASLWQKHIDDGNVCQLPNLYIIQIAIGAQGVREGAMWYPGRAKKLIPGKLGEVDISLFPFTIHILRLLDDSFTKLGEEYKIIGLHWRGGEGEINASQTYLSQNLMRIYTEMFDAFNHILNAPPIVLHKIVCPDHVNKRDPSGEMLQRMHSINRVFSQLEQQYQNLSVFDPTAAPQFDPNLYGNGIFLPDAIHFTSEVNHWVAECIFQDYCTAEKHTQKA